MNERNGISGAFPIVLAVAFDTLKLTRKLEAAGFEHKQAADVSEALAEAFAIAELATKADIERLAVDIERLATATKADIDRLVVATKADLRESEHRLESRIDRLEAKVDAAIASVRADMKAMELRMTVKLGVMLTALFTMTVGAVAAIMRLMLH